MPEVRLLVIMNCTEVYHFEMANQKRISIALKNHIIHLHESDMTQCQIAKDVRFHQSTVSRVLAVKRRNGIVTCQCVY